MTQKFSIVTLGCEKNNVDSEGMGSLLAGAGYEQTSNTEESDVLIVNTCAFLQAAVDESVGELKALAEKKRDDQVLIAAGCMSQRYSEEVPVWVPGVDGVLSTRAWPDIVPLVEGIRQKAGLPTEQQQVTAGAVMPLELMQSPGSVAWAPVAPVQPTAQLKRFRRKAKGASAYVKISEGCDHKCAFCIIPAIRGKHVSKPIAELVAEVRDLAEQGVQECILIAQDSTYYGVDLGL